MKVCNNLQYDYQSEQITKTGILHENAGKILTILKLTGKLHSKTFYTHPALVF